ncbi:putative DnaK suppressor protein [Trichinella spiralis]|uniref:putative DnaK suppressor protein n=1 Tax=Trichinella spiralis TaxID=6334 RepID=UPI0001EFBFCB|nr:putative DnaK suppressor protein [Trichinella spiralis]
MQASQQFCAEIQKILRKPEPPLEKDIQVYRNTDTTHRYNKVHKIHSYCDDEENQKAELLRHMTDHGRNMNRAIVKLKIDTK